MDELPDEARQLLRLASTTHDPPSAETRMRVRRGVAMAVATGVGATIASQAIAQGTVKAGFFSGLAAKLAGASMAVVVVSAVAVSAPKLVSHDTHAKRHETSAQARRDKPPIAQHDALSVVQADERIEVVASPASHVTSAAKPALPARIASTHPPTADRKRASRFHVKGARRAFVAPPGDVDRLRADTALLRRASEAIAQGNTARAERLLDQHGRDFRDSALHEERNGLHALVRCMQNPASAKGEGLRFVTRAPRSVLAQRVTRACQLEEKP